jgi:hypothetical protein
MEEKHTPDPVSEGNMFSQPAQQNLPNSTTVLILGILSIVFSIWYVSLVGVVLSIIALVLAGKDMTLYHSSAGKYSQASYNNLKAGRTCAVIGLIVAIIFFIFIVLLILGILATMPFWGMIDQL